MINLNVLMDLTLLDEFLFICFWFIVPVFTLTIILVLLRFLTKIPDYIFRKILHICAISTIFVFVLAAKTWWISLLAVAFFMVGITIILLIFQRMSFYKKLFVEKENHEVMFMIDVFFVVCAILIAVFFGLKGEPYKYLAIASIMAWGPGDAMAAIIGINFGKHKFNWPFVDDKKSVEGSIAMFITSLITVMVILFIFPIHPWWLIIIESFTVAIVVTFTELVSKRGFDTLFCPLVSGIILFLFAFI